MFSPNVIMVGLDLLRTKLSEKGKMLLDSFIINDYEVDVLLKNNKILKIGGYGKLIEDVKRQICDDSTHFISCIEQDSMKSFIFGLTFISRFCDHYHEVYLNKKLHITRDNIAIIKMFICDGSIEYITNWMKENDSLKSATRLKYGKLINDNASDKVLVKELKMKCNQEICAIESYCLSLQTYNNIRMQHFGFICLAENLFEVCANIKFCPMLFSTQSRLEAEYSMARARNLDSSSNYGVNLKY